MAAATVSAQPPAPPFDSSTFPTSSRAKPCAAAPRPRWSCATGARPVSTRSRSSRWSTRRPEGSAATCCSRDLERRGWNARLVSRRRSAVVQARLSDRQPVVALDRRPPGRLSLRRHRRLGERSGRVSRSGARAVPRHERVHFLNAWAKAGDWTMLMLPPAGGRRAQPRQHRNPSVSTALASASGAVRRPCRRRGSRSGARRPGRRARDVCIRRRTSVRHPRRRCARRPVSTR